MAAVETGAARRAVHSRPRSGRWCAAARAGCSCCSWARCSPPRRWAASRRRSRARWSLALFVPLIISSGGNSGSQAASLIIRALAVGELGVRDWWRVMRREVLAGLVLGSVLGFVGFLRITLWATLVSPGLYGPHWPLVAATVWLSLTGVVLWGTLTGSMLPLILKRAGMDPAVSSAPVRGHAGGRHRHRHLLRGRGPDPARHAALKAGQRVFGVAGYSSRGTREGGRKGLPSPPRLHRHRRAHPQSLAGRGPARRLGRA